MIYTPSALELPAPFDEAEFPAGKEDYARAAGRLMDIFSRYRDYRKAYIEPSWRETYEAYNGVPPAYTMPYASYYPLKEIFREVEALKPQLASVLLPGDKLFWSKID